YAIMPEFGSMDDFDEMLHEIHRRDMKLIMDLVVNHTSDEHPWFIESRSSRDNPKRDWYIWRPPKNGREPNNWSSYFTPSAWQYDSVTEEYYLHLFSRKQPDLNWENPQVRREIFAMMRWWFEKGIDGFRMDVINFLAKAPGLPDAPGDGRYAWPGPLMANQPGMHEILQEMHREVLSRYDVMTVGEGHFIGPEEGLKYAAEDRNELHMVFQFDVTGSAHDVGMLKERVAAWDAVFSDKGHQSVTLGNHDYPRMVSRFGDEREYRVESAKLLATFVLTAPGTPYLYQGDEIGMTNVAFESLRDYRDIESLRKYQQFLDRGMTENDAFRAMRPISRDNARTPMQWDSSPQAGFTVGKPWIGVNPNYREINVAVSEQDRNAILAYYRALIALRKQTPALAYGTYEVIDTGDTPLYAYRRSLDGVEAVVVLNWSGESISAPDGLLPATASLLIGSYAEPKWDDLQPWEARVYAVDK
ncbi:MAG: DUF3459 domain-containing protein, partial [Chitinivibrionales bacterium]|nr:DUF3459 domain-containing protein [Chitinivibrionales bacterium]